MNTRMLIDASHTEETRVVIADDDQVHEFDFVTAAKEQIKGNIYLGKITRVEPSLQAAFVEYGGGKQGFLSFSEIHPDYYQIPADDKERLLEEEQAEAAEEDAAAEAEEQEAEERKSRRSRGGRGRNRRNRRGKRNDEAKDESENAEEAEAKDGEEETTYAEAKTPELDETVSSEPVEEAEEEVEAEALETSAEDTVSDDEADDNGDDSDDDNDDDTEELGGDEVEEVVSTRKKKSSPSRRRYKINEVIKRGQIVLVQAVKEERGNKGASVTTYISLAGRYCVLMPNSLKGGGISRKISGGEERKRLKSIASEMKEFRGLNMIIRTAGIGRTKAEIKRDYEYLVKLWSQIREDTLQSTAPALIHEEGNIIKRSIRDLYNSDFEEILVEGEAAYKEAKAFMKMLMPSHAPRVKQYKDDLPIFSAYGVEEELMGIYNPTAKMPSGGYVVIQPTEALISIDVNSGRSTSERNVEETALKTNLEAAKEIARQLRLRDMAGLIIIDFIDMYYGKNRRAVEKAMKDALKGDRAKIQVARISTFGLMELSRQRLRPNIMEASAQECPHCQGTGFVRSVETVAIQVIRLLEKEATYGDYKTMKVTATSDVALHLLNEKRKSIQAIEEQYNIEIVITVDSALVNGQYKIIKVTHDDKEVLHDDGTGERNKRRRRGGRGRNKNRERGGKDRGDKAETRSDNASSDESDEGSSDTANNKEDGDDKERKPRRSRGRRGGRGRNRNRNNDKQENSDDSERSDDSSTAEAPKPEMEIVEKEAPAPTAEKAPTPANTASALEPAKIETVSKPESSDASDKRKGWWNRVIEG